MSDMVKKALLTNGSRFFREFCQDLLSWTPDALRVGEVLMDDPFKRVKQFFLRSHSALPGRTWSRNSLAVALLAESHDLWPVSMKIFGACIPNFVHAKCISLPMRDALESLLPPEVKTMLNIEILWKEWIAP